MEESTIMGGGSGVGRTRSARRGMIDDWSLWDDVQQRKPGLHGDGDGDGAQQISMQITKAQAEQEEGSKYK